MKYGRCINIIYFFFQRYGIKIHEHNQPLLISRSKARDIRAGRSETIVLIPELCRATGITDEMRYILNTDLVSFVWFLLSLYYNF